MIEEYVKTLLHGHVCESSLEGHLHHLQNDNVTLSLLY